MNAESTLPSDTLSAVPLLAALDPASRQAVLESGELIDYAPGSVIVSEGSAADSLFIMLSGEATVSVSEDEKAPAVDLSIIRGGETFGELGALLNDRRTATVTADSHCRVLRLKTAALEQLFSASPGFGIAFCRELAQRLKRAMALKDELQIENTPERVQFDAPDLTRMREYMVSYYATALRHIFKRHRLIVERKFPTYECQFELGANELRRWQELFGTNRADIPFTYHTMVGTMALMQAVGDVGVNFKNLMHLKSEMSISPEATIEVGRPYRLISQIDDILALRDDRVALVGVSRVLDEHGNRIRSFRDYFIILNLDPEYIETVRSTKGYGRHDAAQFIGLGTREATLGQGSDQTRVATIEVPEGMGFRYGKASGDLNLVHTTQLAARLFGHPRPFIQGLCTANYVVRHLSEHGRLESVEITFAKRVFVQQTIELRYSNDRFEVCDSEGALLAFGSYSVRK